MAANRAVYQSTETVTDMETGEVKQHVSNNVVRIAREPEYVKMYIADLGNLMELTPAQKTLMLALTGRMGFSGIISLNAASRRRLAEQCGLSTGAFRNSLSALCKKGILDRIDSNEFEVNPRYFARGEWAAITQRREDFELRIRYSANGKRTVTTGRPGEEEVEVPPEQGDFGI